MGYLVVTDLSLKKLRMRKGIIHSISRETRDTYTLYIKVDPSDRDYISGQFINIDPHQFPELSEQIEEFEGKKGKQEPIRAYSMCSIPKDEHVAITVKPEEYHPNEDEYPPLLSPLLGSDRLKGREIEFQGYTGAYILKAGYEVNCSEVLHIVSGSGVVPNLALIRNELELNKNPDTVHTFVDINKTRDDIIYRKQLDKLAAKYPDRLKLHHFITREKFEIDENPHQVRDDSGSCTIFHLGRPTVEDYKSMIQNWNQVLVFSCGAGITKWQRQKAKAEGKDPTPRFLEGVQATMTELGVDRKRFKKEAYG